MRVSDRLARRSGGGAPGLAVLIAAGALLAALASIASWGLAPSFVASVWPAWYLMPPITALMIGLLAMRVVASALDHEHPRFRASVGRWAPLLALVIAVVLLSEHLLDAETSIGAAIFGDTVRAVDPGHLGRSSFQTALCVALLGAGIALVHDRPDARSNIAAVLVGVAMILPASEVLGYLYDARWTWVPQSRDMSLIAALALLAVGSTAVASASGAPILSRLRQREDRVVVGRLVSVVALIPLVFRAVEAMGSGRGLDGPQSTVLGIGATALLAAAGVLSIWVADRRRAELVAAERERSRAELAASEAALREAQRIARIGSWSADAATGELTGSDELYRIYGIEPGASLGDLAGCVEDDEERAEVRRRYALAVETGEPFAQEVPIRARDGVARRVRLLGEAVRGTDGRIVGVRGTVADVTELREAQAAAARMERLDSLGRLSAGVAYDVNNLLYGMGLIGGFIAADPDGPAVAEQAAEIVRAAEKGREMTGALITFAGADRPTRTRVDLAEIVRGSLDAIRAALGPGIEVAASLPDDPLAVELDPDGLRRTLTNLVVRAREALPDGGHVSLAADFVTLSPGDAHRLGLDPGPHVRLSVRDDGKPIPPKLLERVFEPFFSPEPQNIGTGLELAAAYGFVREHRGGIDVESGRGGTTFRLYLPVAPVLA